MPTLHCIGSTHYKGSMGDFIYQNPGCRKQPAEMYHCMPADRIHQPWKTDSSDLIQKRKKVTKLTSFDDFFSLVVIRKAQECWQAAF